jgi:hypothetical protein
MGKKESGLMSLTDSEFIEPTVFDATILIVTCFESQQLLSTEINLGLERTTKTTNLFLIFKFEEFYLPLRSTDVSEEYVTSIFRVEE